MNIDAPKQTRKKGKPHGGKGGAEPQSTVQRREHEVLERRAQCQIAARDREGAGHQSACRVQDSPPPRCPLGA